MPRRLRIVLAGLYYIFISFTCYSQASDSLRARQAYYYNQSMQLFRKYATVDSAIHYLNLLADTKSNDLNHLINDELAYTIKEKVVDERLRIDSTRMYLDEESLKQTRSEAFSILQQIMTDGNTIIVKRITPMYYWVAAQQSQHDSSHLRALMNDYLTVILPNDTGFNYKALRYGLLMQKIIATSNSLQKFSDSVLTILSEKIASEFHLLSMEHFTTNKETLDMIWLKYLNAYCNYVKANDLMIQGEIKEAGFYFKNASYLSPDIDDKANQLAYLYDMHILFLRDKESFREDYLAYSKKYNKNADEIQSILLDMALSNPENKQTLKEYYSANHANSQPFNDFWDHATNAAGKIAPDFSIILMDHSLFKLSKSSGKWVLLDFWGTWCGPCRAEHADLEKFYTDISVKDSDRVKILTIACCDKDSSVTTYMAENHYTFPVAMSDGKLDKVYPVNGFPYKILINPGGKFIVIPIGLDWVNFLRKYIGI